MTLSLKSRDQISTYTKNVVSVFVDDVFVYNSA